VCGTIAEAAEIGPKMYLILEETPPKKNIKKATGVERNVVEKEIRHKQCKEALFEKKKKDGMNILRYEGREIYGMRVNKVSLSFDTKRCIEDNGMGTLALGA